MQRPQPTSGNIFIRLIRNAIEIAQESIALYNQVICQPRKTGDGSTQQQPRCGAPRSS
jgi:hypothetical protein